MQKTTGLQDPRRAVDRPASHHRAGRRSEAEALCREVLWRQPRHGGALHLLAQMAHQQKWLGPALKLARMAVAVAGGQPPASGCERAGYFNTLGIVLGDMEKWDECFAALREAIGLALGKRDNG